MGNDNSNIIIVGITDEAQKEAAIAGEPASAVQHYPLSQEKMARAIKLGADILPDGTVVLRHGVTTARDGECAVYTSDRQWQLLSSRPANAAAALDAITASRAAEDARRQAAKAKQARERAEQEELNEEARETVREYVRGALAEHLLGWLDGDAYRLCALGDLARWPSSDLTSARDVLAQCDRLAEVSALAKSQRAEAEAREAADAADFAAALADVVAEHGDASQRARHAAGMLPKTEALALARDVSFAALADRPRYKRLRAGDVPHSDECMGSDCQYDVQILDELTTEQYDALCAVQEALTAVHGEDDVFVAVRTHKGYCDALGCTASAVERDGVLAAMTWHGREFSREYAVGPDRTFDD